MTIDQYGRRRGTIPIDLKTQALDILKRFSVTEIHDDILQQIGTVAVDLCPRYITVARELQLPRAFEALTALDDERVLRWPNFIAPTLVQIDRERAIRWALAMLGKHPSFAVCLLCCDIIQKTGKQQDAACLVYGELVRNMAEPHNRLLPRLYNYLREYAVVEAVPLIIADLSKGWYGRSDRRAGDALFIKRIQTLGSIGDPRGRDYLIFLLGGASPQRKVAILQQLATIGDEPSVNAIRKYMRDSEPVVRDEAKKLVGELT